MTPEQVDIQARAGAEARPRLRMRALSRLVDPRQSAQRMPAGCAALRQFVLRLFEREHVYGRNHVHDMFSLKHPAHHAPVG